MWISFAEEPDYSILPPSSEFIPDDSEGRYEAWSAVLNASDEWICATAFPHPEYDDAAFFTHDLGVLRLSEPVTLPEYGQLPTQGLGVLGTGKGVSTKFSSNANTGGTCFGDSGGPIFVSGTTTLVAVVSFGTSSTCSGTSGAYRIDQEDDLAFLATFGITPPDGT